MLWDIYLHRLQLERVCRLDRMSPSARRFVHASRVYMRTRRHRPGRCYTISDWKNAMWNARECAAQPADSTPSSPIRMCVCVCAGAMPDGGLSVSRSRITANKSASNLQRNQLAERQQRLDHTRNQADATQHHNTDCGILEEMRPGSDLSARVYAHIITACVTDRNKKKTHTP